MRRASTFIALFLSVGCGTLLGGCGSGTQTVSVSSAPPPVSTSATSTRSSASTSSSTSTTTNTSTSTVSTSAGGASPTRTATGPEFAHGGTPAAEASNAAAGVVRAHGYTPVDSSTYHSNQTLSVLVGSRSGSGSQAFFFVNGKYIGTDTRDPSATVNVLSQGETEVTLGYPLYRPQDALGNPTGGEAKVRFQLNDGKLTPLNPIPSASSSSSYSRR